LLAAACSSQLTRGTNLKREARTLDRRANAREEERIILFAFDKDENLDRGHLHVPQETTIRVLKP
jgi:hypothetical protein